MRNRLLVFVTLAAWLWAGVAAQAQTVWPPIGLDARGSMAGNQVTFEIKLSNVTDFTLVDLTLKASVPTGATYAAGHPDFDGGVVGFDGQDASFFVIALPARATLGFRYTVELESTPADSYPLQVWAGWKGRLPGQALFRPDVHLAGNSQSGPAGDSVSRAIANGLDIIHVYGSPFEQGVERGRQLATKIQTETALHLAAVLPQSFGGSREPWIEAIRPITDQLDPDLLAELQGMSEGSGVSLDDLLLVNLSSYVASVDVSAPSSVACSVLVTADGANQSGGLLIGRQQDSVSDDISPVFIVRHFDDRRPNRVDITQPATLEIAATLTAGGLFWEGHPAFSRESMAPGATDLYSLVARTLRTARNLDEMEKSFGAAPRLKAMNSTVADLKTGEVRSLELGFGRQAEIKPDGDGVLISTNHFSAPELQDLRPPTVNRSLTRYDRLRELVTPRLGRIERSDLETFLHDPDITSGSGATLVVDPRGSALRYWDQWRGQWFTLTLPDLLGSSILAD